MTAEKEKKYRHLIARFESTRHSFVNVISEEELENGQCKVVAALRCFKYVYIFKGEGIVGSWRVIA